MLKVRKYSEIVSISLVLPDGLKYTTQDATEAMEFVG